MIIALGLFFAKLMNFSEEKNKKICKYHYFFVTLQANWDLIFPIEQLYTGIIS